MSVTGINTANTAGTAPVEPTWVAGGLVGAQRAKGQAILDKINRIGSTSGGLAIMEKNGEARVDFRNQRPSRAALIQTFELAREYKKVTGKDLPIENLNVNDLDLSGVDFRGIKYTLSAAITGRVVLGML